MTPEESARHDLIADLMGGRLRFVGIVRSVQPPGTELRTVTLRVQNAPDLIDTTAEVVEETAPPLQLGAPAPTTREPQP